MGASLWLPTMDIIINIPMPVVEATFELQHNVLPIDITKAHTSSSYLFLACPHTQHVHMHAESLNHGSVAAIILLEICK